MLVASAHTANSDRPLDAVRTYSQTFAQRIVHAFERAVIDQIAVILPTSTTGHTTKTFDDVYADLELVPPAILRVVVNTDGHATLSGVATPGVEVIIRSPSRTLGQTTVLPRGQWQLRLATALDQGVHRMRSIARVPRNGHQQPGQEVRIALPQTLTKPLVVLDEMSEGDAIPAVHKNGGHQTNGQDQPDLYLVQAGARDPRRRDREAREPFDNEDRGLADPLFAWLQRSAIAYDRWIVDDLSGGNRGWRYVLRGRDEDRDKDFVEDDLEDRSGRRFANRDGVTGLGDRWQSFRVGVIEWFRQAQLSYRENVVEPLSTGERVSRDRYARAEPETADPVRPRRRERDAEPTFDDDWTLPELNPSPSAEAPPQNPDPISDWPVVRDERFDPPPLPEVTPDLEKEALIRKAEEDAEKARQLARKAAEQAEAARKATEALLAEEKRLQSDGAARRAAAERAASEAELNRRADEAEKRAAAAEARAKEAERMATANAQGALNEQDAREAAQRKAAEDLAAAASAAADREFAAGRVRKPPVATDTEPQIAEADPEPSAPTPQQGSQEFSVADTRATPRLSIKDSAEDAVIEEGSTLGDIDDFDPSVRYVYDMGDGVLPKAKRKAKRIYKKRRAKSRKAKRKYRYRKHARKRRAAKVRGYRKRRTRYKRRARVRRAYRRVYRRVHRFGRRYKFKARRRVHYRRHAYARPVFIPRLRWRRW